MPDSTFRSFSEKALVRSRVSQNNTPRRMLLEIKGTAMADRMPWATIDSEDEKRESRMASAVSTALRKLRELCNDALLVRERSGMVPTERALQLREHALAALAQIDAMRAGPARFEPAHSTQTFHIASPDYLAMGFLGGVVERVRREAPRARLEVHPLAADYDYEQALADGRMPFSDHPLWERAQMALRVTAAAPLLALCAWGYDKLAEPDMAAHIATPKTRPVDVAHATLDGVEQGIDLGLVTGFHFKQPG